MYKSYPHLKIFCDRDKYNLRIKIDKLLHGGVAGYLTFGTREYELILHSNDDIWHLDDPEKTVGIMLSFLSALNFNLK